MDKDFIIGIVLIFLILLGWQTLAPKPEPVQEAEQAAGPAVPAAGQEPAMVPAPGQNAPPALVGTPSAPGAPGEKIPDVVLAKPAAETIPALPPVEITSKNVNIELTNVGGRIKSWRLNKFNDVAGEKGKPLEMVSMPESGKFSLATYWVGSGPTLTERDTYEILSRDPQKTVFARNDPAGFRIRKTFEPDLDKYSVKLTVDIESLGTASAQGRLTVCDYHRESHEKRGFFRPNINATTYVAFVDGDLKKKPLPKAPGESYPGNVIWAGFDSVYFLAGIAPDVSETTQAQVLESKGPNDPLTSTITMPESLVPPGGKLTFVFHGYMGPKSEEFLAGAGNSFDQALDFGWFTAISKWLVRFLMVFFNWTGNWGVAIIIVTVIIKILMYPLTYKSFKSMKGMSALQPEMKKLREMYKDDREKLNQEMMGLYKAHGVNPASGCLPVLLQLPVFLAFYRALYGTI